MANDDRPAMTPRNSNSSDDNKSLKNPKQSSNVPEYIKSTFISKANAFKNAGTSTANAVKNVGTKLIEKGIRQADRFISPVIGVAPDKSPPLIRNGKRDTSPLPEERTQDDLLTRRSQLEHEFLLLLDGNTGMINYRRLIITGNPKNVPFYSALYLAKRDCLKNFYSSYEQLMEEAKHLKKGRGPGVQPMSTELCSLCEELINWNPEQKQLPGTEDESHDSDHNSSSINSSQGAFSANGGLSGGDNSNRGSSDPEPPQQD